jgi:hypothetical protein
MMMAVIEVARVDSAALVKGRLEQFGREVLVDAMSRPAQMANGGLYLRGLVGEGKRKSLEPLVARLGGEADYQSMQQFLTDSPWDAAEVVRAVTEWVAPVIDVEAWVLDDTGFPKQGKRSPGVKRQYSGTLGKIGNCQIGVSVHAVGVRGTVPLGWALYLPQEWCEYPQRRAKAKIPEEVEFKTKLQLGQELIERLGGSPARVGKRRWQATERCAARGRHRGPQEDHTRGSEACACARWCATADIAHPPTVFYGCLEPTLLVDSP